jgi:hypothetical protein
MRCIEYHRPKYRANELKPMSSSPLMNAPPLRDALSRSFLRHFLEMILAMVAGMILLDEVAWLMFSRFAGIDMFAYPILYAPVMTVNMTIGMSLWMLYRRHALRSICEMAGAMFIPLCILIGPHWAGMLSGDVLVVGSMALMLPAMVLVMLYRRGEYARGHHHHDHLASISREGVI